MQSHGLANGIHNHEGLDWLLAWAEQGWDCLFREQLLLSVLKYTTVCCKLNNYIISSKMQCCNAGVFTNNLADVGQRSPQLTTSVKKSRGQLRLVFCKELPQPWTCVCASSARQMALQGHCLNPGLTHSNNTEAGSLHLSNTGCAV